MAFSWGKAIFSTGGERDCVCVCKRDRERGGGRWESERDRLRKLTNKNIE